MSIGSSITLLLGFVTQMVLDIIIPVFNQFDYVTKCINSVLRSGCSTKSEIIVIDDGSTDLRLKEFLRRLEKRGAARLFTNEQNMGFTRAVNFAMKLHKDKNRDVLLLNSDTLVYGSWLDRIVKGAYSSEKIATVNPMTNSRGSHISYYPYLIPWDSADEVTLEVSDDTLNSFAAEKNDGKYVQVHTTVGFCMFIKRACLNDIGYFDYVNFPAYGEESDFCYRGRKAGWQHLIVGDVFVTHLEGKSFGNKKIELMNRMFEKFKALHPEVSTFDQGFRTRDPVRVLRAGLDLARVKHGLRSRKSIDIYVARDSTTAPVRTEEFYLIYLTSERAMRLCAQNNNLFPNLETYAIPKEMLKFNKAMNYLGVEMLCCNSEFDRLMIEKDVLGLPIEFGLGPRLAIREESASQPWDRDGWRRGVLGTAQ